jgi:hypothetical protein
MIKKLRQGLVVGGLGLIVLWNTTTGRTAAPPSFVL